MTLEYIPDPSRVSPPAAAAFALAMLATTEAGDAYTFAEYEGMFARAGFARSEFYSLPPATQQSAFTVTRLTAGQPVTVNLVVVDGCGDWPTIVGVG